MDQWLQLTQKLASELRIWPFQGENIYRSRATTLFIRLKTFQFFESSNKTLWPLWLRKSVQQVSLWEAKKYHIFLRRRAVQSGCHRVALFSLPLFCCSVLVHIIFTSICSRDLNWILRAKLYTFSCFSYSHKQIYRLFGRFKLHKIKLYFVRVPRCLKHERKRWRKCAEMLEATQKFFSRCCLCGFEKFKNKNNLHSTLSRCWPRPMQKLYLYVELFKRAEYWLSTPDTTSLTLYRKRSDYMTMAYWDVAVIFRFIDRFSTVPSPEREVRKLPRSKQCEIHQAQLNVIITKQMFAGDEKKDS